MSALSDFYARITGTTATPLISGGYVSRSGMNLVFLPAVSNIVYRYVNSVWTPQVIPSAGFSVACTGLSNSTDYNVYLGAAGIELSTTATTTQNTVRVKSGETFKTLVAKVRTNASGAVVSFNEDASMHLIQNEYNRRPVQIYKHDTTESWTYNSTTFRAANSNTNYRVQFLANATTEVRIEVMGFMTLTAAANPNGSHVVVGIGLDSTTTNSALTGGSGGENNANTTWYPTRAVYMGLQTEGFHYAQILERCTQAISSTLYNNSPYPPDNTGYGAANCRGGIIGEILA